MRVNWEVMAPFAAVVVTAALGAWGIAREQSAMRQLERVTAVLKDAGDDFEGRAELLWLQTALSRRVNRQYRAPQKRGVLFYAWALRIASLGMLLWVYFVLTNAFFSRALTDEVGQPRVGATWATIVAITVLGVLGAIVGALQLRRREKERAEWLRVAEPDSSEAAQL